MSKVISSASHHAMLFAFIAKRTIDKFGKDGEKAVTDGVRHYGEQRGHRMALRTLADGNQLDVENYLIYGEWSAAPGEMDLRFPRYSPEVRMENHNDPSVHGMGEARAAEIWSVLLQRRRCISCKRV